MTINNNSFNARYLQTQMNKIQQKQEEVKNEAKSETTASTQQQTKAEFKEQGENLLDQMSMLANYNKLSTTSAGGILATASTQASSDEVALPQQDGNKITLGEKSITIPDGFEASINDDGTVTFVKADGSAVETRNYDANLNKTTLVKDSGDGNVKTYTYGESGKTSSIEQKYDDGKVTTTFYAEDGKTKNAIITKNADGVTTTWKYEGGILSEKIQSNATGTSLTGILYEGDVKSGTYKMTIKDGITTERYYDANNVQTLACKVDTDGTVTKTEYDEQGRQAKITTIDMYDVATVKTYNPETKRLLNKTTVENASRKGITTKLGSNEVTPEVLSILALNTHFSQENQALINGLSKDGNGNLLFNGTIVADSIEIGGKTFEIKSTEDGYQIKNGTTIEFFNTNATNIGHAVERTSNGRTVANFFNANGVSLDLKIDYREGSTIEFLENNIILATKTEGLVSYNDTFTAEGTPLLKTANNSLDGSYDYEFYKYGQLVEKQSCDEKGVVRESTFDLAGTPMTTAQINPDKSVVYEEFEYGKLVNHTEVDKSDKATVTTYQYDATGNATTQTQEVQEASKNISALQQLIVEGNTHIVLGDQNGYQGEESLLLSIQTAEMPAKIRYYLPQDDIALMAQCLQNAFESNFTISLPERGHGKILDQIVQEVGQVWRQIVTNPAFKNITYEVVDENGNVEQRKENLTDLYNRVSNELHETLYPGSTMTGLSTQKQEILQLKFIEYIAKGMGNDNVLKWTETMLSRITNQTRDLSSYVGPGYTVTYGVDSTIWVRDLESHCAKSLPFEIDKWEDYKPSYSESMFVMTKAKSREQSQRNLIKELVRNNLRIKYNISDKDESLQEKYKNRFKPINIVNPDKEDTGIMDGKFDVGDRLRQGAWGDCYLISALNELNATEQGNAFLRSCVKPDDEGNLIVAFPSGRRITITPEMLENDLITGHGDRDLVAIELAILMMLDDERIHTPRGGANGGSITSEGGNWIDISRIIFGDVEQPFDDELRGVLLKDIAGGAATVGAAGFAVAGPYGGAAGMLIGAIGGAGLSILDGRDVNIRESSSVLLPLIQNGTAVGTWSPEPAVLNPGEWSPREGNESMQITIQDVNGEDITLYYPHAYQIDSVDDNTVTIKNPWFPDKPIVLPRNMVETGGSADGFYTELLTPQEEWSTTATSTPMGCGTQQGYQISD